MLSSQINEYFCLLKRRSKVYGSFLHNAFLMMLAYRLRYVTGILTYILFVSVHYFLWQAIYSGRVEHGELHGFTLSEMITYIAVGWVARSFYFSDVDRDIDELVSTGQISVSLLRPVNFQLMLFAQAIGQSIFRALFFSVPIGIVVLWLYPVQPPASIVDFLLFLGATGVGFLIFAQINFLVGLLAFRFKSIEGIVRAKYFIVQLCSGLLLPIAFFPSWAQTLLHILPFQSISYIPLQFYLGHIRHDQLTEIFLLQFGWFSLFLLGGNYFWQKALAKLTLQGG